MKKKEYTIYKILFGFFKALEKLRLKRLFNRIAFTLKFILEYKRFYQIRIEYPLKIPSPCIITINHLSDEDTVIIQTINEVIWHNPISLVLAHFNFEKFYSPYIYWIDAISNKGTGNEVVNRMVNALEKGKTIAIWPEGNFTRTGAVMNGFTGVTRAYIQANYGNLEKPNLKLTPKIPILPIFLEGVYESLNPYAHAISKRKMFYEKYGTSRTQWRVIIGKPYFLKCPDQISKDTLRTLTNQIQIKIQKLDPLKRPIVSNPLQKKN